MAARLYNFFNALYSLETLDTRFVTSSTAPQKAALDPAEATGSERSKKPQPRHDAQPSKWRTTEYYVYYLVFIVIVPTMFKQVYDISQPGAPGYDEFSRRLSKGWIFGRKVDNSDGQYAHFRDNIFVMTGLLILHPLLRKVYGAFWRIDTYTNTKPVNGNSSGLSHGLSPSAAADARLQFRVSYDLIFGAVFLIALNGVSASKVFAILYLNYKIATQLPRSYVPAATWIFNVGVLFANELCKGYPFLGIMRLLLPKVQIAHDLGATLDRYGGLNPRWEVLFNISILRHISFNLDRYWAQARGASSPIEKKQVDPALLSERDRVSYGASFNDFTLRNYLAYTLYAPLYLTGPIIGFNDYIAQSRYPLPSITSVRTFMYGVRFLVLLLTMEVVLHYIYVVSLIQTSPHWSQYNAYQLSMLGYFNLHIVWLKLLIPWRFFRLWALADGVDAPENMVRCMSDNYSTLSFWRSWHRSLNRWIVRYIYVPLGGSGTGKLRTLGNVAAVFTFIALWHDINLRLLAWGWLITLFVLPEVVAMVLFPKKKWAQYPETFRVLCGVGAVANVLMMMLANLVGFVTGLDGVRELIRGIVSGWSGMAFVAAACATLFVGVQVMFEHREAEKRHGIDLKC